MCSAAYTTPLSKSHICTDLPPTSLEQFLRAIGKAVSWAVVLVLPQINLNLQIACCALFKVSTSVLRRASLAAPVVENLPATQQTWVWSLGWEDPLEKGIASYPLTSLVAQMVKRLPTMRETQVQSLGREDLLEKEMATPSSILAWKIPWTVEPGRLQSMGSQRVGHDWVTSLQLSLSSILAWGTPRTEELGQLQPMGSQNVRHNWATKLSLSVSLGPIPLERREGSSRGRRRSSASVIVWEPRDLLDLLKLLRIGQRWPKVFTQRLFQHCLWPFLRTVCISWVILKEHGQSH